MGVFLRIYVCVCKYKIVIIIIYNWYLMPNGGSIYICKQWWFWVLLRHPMGSVNQQCPAYGPCPKARNGSIYGCVCYSYIIIIYYSEFIYVQLSHCVIITIMKFVFSTMKFWLPHFQTNPYNHIQSISSLVGK